MYYVLLQLSLQIYLSISMSIDNRHHICTYLKKKVAIKALLLLPSINRHFIVTCESVPNRLGLRPRRLDT